MGIKSTEIVYRCGRLGENTCKAGDTVHGTVNVKIGGHKSHKISAMIVKVRGRAKTDWEDGDDNYSETLDIFRKDIHLKDVAPGETISLPPGDHQLPFNFTLPAKLPHSQKFDEAKVVYECKARLVSDSMWSRDGHEEARLTVLPELDLSQIPHLAEPLKVKRQDEWTMWDGNPGEFTATIAKQGYVAGEMIDLWIEGTDSVYSALAELDGQVKLKRLVLSRAGKKDKHEDRTAIATARPGKTPSAWHRVHLTVPENEITMDNEALCRIISVTYYVKVRL